MTHINLPARAYHRILKLARTIAKLTGCEEIGPMHLAEALSYRPKVMLGYGDLLSLAPHLSLPSTLVYNAYKRVG